MTGVHISEEQLKDAARASGVLDVDSDFLLPEFRAKCNSEQASYHHYCIAI